MAAMLTCRPVPARSAVVVRAAAVPTGAKAKRAPALVGAAAAALLFAGNASAVDLPNPFSGGGPPNPAQAAGKAEQKGSEVAKNTPQPLDVAKDAGNKLPSLPKIDGPKLGGGALPGSNTDEKAAELFLQAGIPANS